MKKNTLMILLILLPGLIWNTSFAFDITSARIDTVNRYLSDLENGNAKDIISLFEENGTVVSTSRGRMKAKDFFNAFLPEIEKAATNIHQTFSGFSDADRIAVRFHFEFKLKDGEIGEGEYIDEFAFSVNSTKLMEVIMFENGKFK